MKRKDEEISNVDDVHTQIHPELLFPYNSVNIIVGKMGSGKSRLVYREVGKLRWVKHSYHLLIIVTKEGNDKTFKKYKSLISVPIIKISYDDAFRTLSDIKKAKDIYEEEYNMRHNLPNNHNKPLTSDELQTLIKFLRITGFKTPVLHTLILFDDCSEIFKNKCEKKMKELVSLFLKNRHHKFTYFFVVHAFTADTISPLLKKNATTVWYFGGYSKQAFVSGIQQLNAEKLGYEKSDLWDEYSKVGDRDIVWFSYAENNQVIRKIKLDLNEDGEIIRRNGVSVSKNGDIEEDYEEDDEEEDENEYVYGKEKGNINRMIKQYGLRNDFQFSI
jgi:hypothetical protein